MVADEYRWVEDYDDYIIVYQKHADGTYSITEKTKKRKHDRRI